VLALETGIPFTLIESDGRKAAFLLDAARELAAPVKVLNTRIEAAKTTQAPLITARALAPLDKLLALAAPHLAPGGVCLFPKGRTYEEELKAAETHWRMEVERCKNPFDAEACILKLGKIHHAGKSG
jgi:16S rRNA (guanine527-N7)-methyltransferase